MLVFLQAGFFFFDLEKEVGKDEVMGGVVGREFRS